MKTTITGQRMWTLAIAGGIALVATACGSSARPNAAPATAGAATTQAQAAATQVPVTAAPAPAATTVPPAAAATAAPATAASVPATQAPAPAAATQAPAPATAAPPPPTQAPASTTASGGINVSTGGGRVNIGGNTSCLPPNFPLPPGTVVAICADDGHEIAVRAAVPSSQDAFNFYLAALAPAGYTITNKDSTTVNGAFIANIDIDGNGFSGELGSQVAFSPLGMVIQLDRG